MNTTNLLGLTQQQLSDFAEEIGEPRYRGKQIFDWIYSKGVVEIGLMTDLGKTFRSELGDTANISGLSLVTQQHSSDGTTKFLFRLADNTKIESVLIPPSAAFRDKMASGENEQRRLTLCVSTQVGCPLDCSFCATATMGYVRNMTTGEIVDQALQVRRITGKKITNIVFMGMGEPMMNYDNVMNAAEIFSTGVGITARRITLSTAGWADRIRQMGDEKRRTKLAISLHSADNATRTKLMPINKRFDLESLLSAIEYYYSRTKQRVTYEYIFFDGVNDSHTDIAKLIRLARRVPSKINVIPFHSIDSTHPVGYSASLKPSPHVERNVDILRSNNIAVFVRNSTGLDIDAACGQLAVKNNGRQARNHSRSQQDQLKTTVIKTARRQPSVIREQQ
jgi:23S rRNA (adenine2503-C2)-methyltransferase